MIVAALMIVLFGGAAALLVTRRRAMLSWLAVVPLLVALGIAVWAGITQPVVSWAWWGSRFDPQIAVVGISRVLLVLVPMIAIPVVLYAAASARSEPAAPRLLALLVAFTGSMELLVVAADFLTLLIAWELVGACSWALIGYEWRDPARPRAALNAFVTTRTGDLGLYLAAAATVAATGSVRFEALAGVSGPTLHVIAAGVLLAAAAKSAQLPFSPWLFSAMAGPTAASALLHSATMVAAGAYLVARLAGVFEPTGWFAPTVAWLGLATAIGGGLVASLQSDLKKALAASTSAQYGLMFVAVGAGFTAAATVHLVTHAAFKALLFLGAGVALQAAGTTDLERLRVGAALPRTARLFAIGALALAAVPPLGAAYSKEQILAAAGQAPSGGTWLLTGVVAATFLSAFYAGRLYWLAFGRGPLSSLPGPAPAATWSLSLLAGLSVVLGALWLPGADVLVERLLDGRFAREAEWLLALSLITIAAAGVISWVLFKRGTLLTLAIPDRVRIPAAGWLGLPVVASRGIVDPALHFSHALASFDDRVVDAGIRAAAAVSTLISRVIASSAERGLEQAVSAIAHVTTALAGASGRADDSGIDVAVEGLAREIGAVGRQSRRLQTGLAHHYYVVVAAGALVLFVVAAFGR